VNGKRLLGIYKDEKQSHGKHGSMFKVAWNFCKTRIIISSIFYTLSTLSALSAPVFFLKLTLDQLDAEPDTNKNGTYRNIFKLFEFTFNFYGRWKCIYLMLGFISCLIVAIIFKGITNWLNLRTAIRLRSAVLAATYRKAMKSSITNNIAAHQILTDDIENVMQLVDYMTRILGTIIAVILAIVASAVLLHGPGIWPILAAIGFFCIPIILAKISTNRLRKSMHYLLRKMTIIEDFCINFRDISVHALTYDYIKQFYCKL